VGGEGVADGGEHHVVLLEEGFHVDVGVRCRQVDDGQVEQARGQLGSSEVVVASMVTSRILRVRLERGP
jgi:hypothetical protein